MTSNWDGTQPVEAATAAPGTFKIMLGGEIDLDRKPELRALADDYAASDDPSVEVDLTRVSFIDSTGMGLLVRLHATAAARGGTVYLVGPSQMCRKVLQVTAIDQLVEIREPDLSDAVGGRTSWL